MKKHIQTVVGEDDFKRIKKTAIDQGKELKDFAKEALIEKCDKADNESHDSVS